jgi:hypothetical protein
MQIQNEKERDLIGYYRGCSDENQLLILWYAKNAAECEIRLLAKEDDMDGKYNHIGF